MGEAARIWTTVGANIAPLKAGLAEAGAATDKFAGSIGQRLANPASMEKFGRSWNRNVSLPLIATGAIATKMALDFHQQMQLISTSAGGSAKDVKELTTQVLQLAKVSPYGPTELAKALYHLKSLGYDNVTAMRTLQVAIHGALAGNSDLESTTSALGAVIRTNIKGTGDFAKTMATLNAGVGVGNMRMQDLIGALGTGVLPAAKAAGLSLKDVIAALALMVDEGMPATQAATRLRMGFTLMEHGSKSANTALKEIGLSSDKLSLILHSPAGLVGGLQLLKDHLDRLGGGDQLRKWAEQVDRGRMSVTEFQKLAAQTKQFDVLAGAFGGARSSAAILLMLNNLDVLKSKYVQMQPVIDKFGAKVKQAENLPINKLKKDWSNIEVSLIAAGDAITPFVEKAAHGLAELTGWFAHLNSFQRTFLILAASGGPLLIFLSRVIRAVETIGGAWAGEAAASTEATNVVVGNIERQGLAAASLKGELLSLTSKAFMVTMVLSMIPQNKHGANLLDQNHLGFFNHIPLLDRVAQYGALAGHAASLGLDNLAYSATGVPGPQQIAEAARRRYQLTHPAPQKPVNMTLSYQEWLNLHPDATAFGDAEAQKVYARYRAKAEAQYRTEEQGYKLEVELYKKNLDKHVSEAQRRNDLMHKAEEQFKRQWAHIFGKSNYTPPNIPGGDNLTGTSTVTSYKLPSWVTTMQARADALAAMNPNATGPSGLQIKAAQAAKAAAMAALRAHSKAWQGAADAWNAVAAANQVLYQQSNTFQLPMRIQLAQAKADALAALNPNLSGPTSAQIQAAKQAKEAAMKAINSHKLTMQQLIAAWGIVQQANGVLAQQLSGQAHTYAATSTAALTKGLHLSDAARKALEQRLAQRAAHGGNHPVGPASDGVVIEPHGHHHHHHHHHHHGRDGGGNVIVNGPVILHGTQSESQLYAALQKGPARARAQRAGQR